MKMADAAKLQPWTGFGATAFSYFGKAAEMIVVWHRRARDRDALRRLTDHYLCDIGLTRYDVMVECGKPFWRP